VTRRENIGGMPKHTVAEGECLSSIAHRYGFFWKTLWDHPENARVFHTAAPGKDLDCRVHHGVTEITEHHGADFCYFS
jgi:hypothetical protein